MEFITHFLTQIQRLIPQQRRGCVSQAFIVSHSAGVYFRPLLFDLLEILSAGNNTSRSAVSEKARCESKFMSAKRRTHLNNSSHNLSLKRDFLLIQPDACVGNILVGVGGCIWLFNSQGHNDLFTPAEANACFYPGGQFFIRANVFLVLLNSELIISSHLSTLKGLGLNSCSLSFLHRSHVSFC